MNAVILIVSFILCNFVPDLSAHTENLHVPRIISSQIDGDSPVFHGTLREDEHMVQLDPPLRAEDDDSGEAGLICGYMVHNEREKRIPFMVEVTDSQTGAAEVHLRSGEELNYEKRTHYKFAISAYNCGSPVAVSKKAYIIIQVEDKNEFAPHFEKDGYFLDLEEGKMFDFVLQVQATDGDRSPEFHEICSYHILTPGEPFNISKEGIIRNTEPLSLELKTNHILVVVAEDCGHLRSDKPTMVNVQVVAACSRGWHGIPTRFNYFPMSGRQQIAPDARLDICDVTCDINRVSVRVAMETKHIGKGCDRDTYTITSQRKICGADTDGVDLLPSLTSYPVSETKSLPVSDDGHDADQIFAFDGRINSVEIPSGQFGHHLSKQFTFSTWMKHERNEDKSAKEHILCTSDATEMNRHHYSWFVHGEKMVFLIRREAEDAQDFEEFKPAEYRWHVPQVDDGRWHHYTLTMDFPEVNLYIDGKLLIVNDDVYEVIDDWPLHPAKDITSTKMVVGACWQGKKKELDMYFRGYLAGLYALNGKQESDQVIKCLSNCQENLDFHSLNKMQAGTVITFNTDMTEISITGSNVSSVVNVVQEIGYLNTRSYPTPGRRNVNLQTTVICDTDDEDSQQPLPSVPIPELNTYIMVMQAETPIISITGTKNLARTVDDLAFGQRIFRDMSIGVTNDGDEEEQENLEDEIAAHDDLYKMSGEDFLLDQCSIKADPHLNLEYERLTFPRNLMALLSITENEMDSTETNEGVVINGLNKLENYQQVMREINYYHEDADQLSIRKFNVTCSSQNLRFLSNVLSVTISAIHEQIPVKEPAYMQQDEAVVEHAAASHILAQPVNAVAASATPSLGMVAIIVVCVGFLMFMIILGVIRIRAHHRRTQVVTVDEKAEMEWDYNAEELNITVNPIETQEFGYAEETEMQQLTNDDSDSDDDDDDDDDSYRDDIESSEDEAEKIRDRELEWDDSTLSI